MGLIRTFDGQTNVFLGSVGLGATPNERLTVNGSISANNTIFGKSISSGNYLGTWSGDPLSSDQVIVESVDLKTTNISGGLILAADGKGGVEFVENTGVSNINNIEGNLTVTGYISAGGNLSANTINAATSFISGGVDLFDIFGAGGCSGGIGGAGTINKIPKFTTSSCIGDSLISELGTTITVNGNLSAKCNLNIDGDSTILGNLSVHGDMHYIDTNVTVTSALSVVNTGTGPALFVRQDGAEPIAHFIDKDGDDIVFADDGKLGIGTFNPDEKLTVVGNASASSNVFAKNNVYSGNKLFVFGESTSAGNYICNNSSGDTTFFNNGGERMTIENAGNVGIGTATPGDKLTIQGNISSSGDLCLVDNGKIRLGNSSDLCIYHDGTDSYVDNGIGDLILRTAGSGDDVFVRATDDVFIQPGNGASGITAKGGGAVELYHNSNKKLETTTDGINVTGTVTSDGHTIAGNLSSNGTGIFKSLSAEDSNCCNYFAGNVGIGTTVPEAPLHVNAAGGTLAQFHRSGTQLVTIGGSSNMGQIRFQYGSDCVSTGATTGGDYRIDTGGSVGAGDNMFYVCKGGNVGIGTTAPAEKLTVAGNISANGGITATCSCCNSTFAGNVGIGTTTVGKPLVVDDSGSAGGICVLGASLLGTFERCIGTANVCVSILGSSADPQIRYNTGTKCWAAGLDQSADSFVIADGSEIHTGSYKLEVGTGQTSVYGNLSAKDRITSESISVSATTRGILSAGRDLADIFQVEPGGIDGSGTACKIPIWTDSDTIGNSILSATSSTATVQGNFCSCALSSTNASCDNYFAGNVGIGTISPQRKLDVRGTSGFQYAPTAHDTQGSIVLIADGSNNSYIELKDGSSTIGVKLNTSGDSYLNGGNVGIGTTTPSAPLHVTCNGDVSTVIIHRDGSDPGSSALVNRINFKTDFSSVESDVGKIDVCTNASSFRTDMDFFVKSTGGNICKGLTVHGTTNDGARVGIGNNVSDPTEALTVMGNITGSGDITSCCGTICGKIVRGTSCVVATKVDSQMVSNAGEVCITSGCQGCVRIGTSNAFAMTLSANSAGTPRVGIGTSTPDKALVVRGNSAEVVIDDIDSTDTPRLRFRESGNTSGQISTDSCNLRLFTQSSERMRLVNSTGNVGIGTTSPACKLTVAGTVSACGGFRVADLEIQRSASENYISSSSELRINSDVTRILKNNLGEYMANFYGDAAVELYYNGTKRFETTNTGAKITGNICATNDANFDGDLTVRDVFVRNLSATHSICTAATTNGFVSAGRDLADIFETAAAGVDGSGTAGKLPVWTDSDTLGDSPISSISSGISIGSCGLNITTGSTVDKIQSDASFLVLEGDNVILRNCGGSEDYGKFQENGAVLLYHNNVQKFETTSAGITVNGSISSKGYCSDVNENTFLGTNALANSQSQTCNTAVGEGALQCNATGHTNVAIGACAIGSGDDGCYNVAVGEGSLCMVTGNDNVAIGRSAMRNNTCGGQNTAVGRLALLSNTTSSNNVGVGYAAGCSNTTGCCNTSIGSMPLRFTTTGSNNIALGYQSLYCAVTASNNIAIGPRALMCTTTGTQNVGIGKNSLCVNTEGSCNTAIGYLAMNHNTTGVENTAIGRIALCKNTTGGRNIAIGGRAMIANTTGCCNVGIGVLATRCQTSGCFNVGIGTCALFANLTSTNNTAIGAFALKCTTTGTQNTAIGRNSGCANTEGTQNTSVGANSFVCNTTGSFNANLGYNAGFFNTTGNYNTGIGYNANQDVTEGDYNTAVGFYANRNTCTGNCNTALGSYALNTNTTGGNNVAVGMMALCANCSGSNSVGIGKFALRNNTTASGNIAVGHSALCGNTTATGNTAVGCEALKANTDQINNTAIGLQVLASNTTGSSNTGLGAQALLANTSGYQNTAVGEGSLINNTCGLRNTALGYKSGYCMTSGDYNVALGCGALHDTSTAECNTAVGNAALLLNTAGCNTGVGAKAACANTSGFRNVAVGHESLKANTIGCYNVALGERTLQTAVTASSNTAVGASASFCNTTGCKTTAIGFQSLFKNSEGILNTAVGANSLVCNTTGLGNTAVGESSLGCNCTDNYSTAVGYLSLRCSTGARNVGIGVSAGCRNSGACNTFLGYEAGRFNCEGNRVTALGYQALGSACNCANNSVAVGALALRYNTTGATNHAFGYQALECNTTGCVNTAVGPAALFNNVSGNFNIGIGSSAASGNCSGHCNIAIGNNAGRTNTSGGCNISIGPLAARCGNGVCQNIAVGTCSLFLNVTGSDNLMMGHLAGYATNAHNNMGIGTGALQCNSIGTQNVVIGRCAAQQNTSGGYNTVLGGSAFKTNTTGGFNVAVGNVALFSNCNASNNVAVGYGAAYNNTTASGTVAIGFYANYNNCTAIFNTTVGAQAMQCNTGACNTALGYCALHNNSSATRNTAVGMKAGVSTTTGACNTIVGSEALLLNSTGSSNVAVGQAAMYANTCGTDNVALGVHSLYNNTTACYNVGVGRCALFSTSTGIWNTSVGYMAGKGNTTGAHNANLGSYAGECNGAAGCNTYIGYAAGRYNTCPNNVVLGFNSARCLANGSTTLSCASSGVYIGDSVRGCANGEVNAIAIGYGTCSCGSNTVNIGNACTTTTYLNGHICGCCSSQGVFGSLSAINSSCNNYFAGNVGIGTNTPGYALTIDDGDLLVCTAGGGYFQVDESACAVKHSDCVKAMFGTGNDLQIYHDGNNWIDANGVGDLYLRNLNSSGDVVVQAGASGDTYIKVNSGETALKATNNGATELYYDDSKKLETTNVGVCVTGHVCACGNGYFSCVIAGGYFEEKAANPSLAGYPTGTIVSIGESGDLIKSTVKNDRKVFGVTQNGACQPIVLGAEPVLVTGDIKIGDYITTSSKPGHGMKATCTLHGAVIAQAMEAGCGDSYLVKAMIRKM